MRGPRVLLATFADGMLDRDRFQSVYTRAQARHSHPGFVWLCSDAVPGVGVDIPLLDRDEGSARDILLAACLAIPCAHWSEAEPDASLTSPLVLQPIDLL